MSVTHLGRNQNWATHFLVRIFGPHDIWANYTVRPKIFGPNTHLGHKSLGQIHILATDISDKHIFWPQTFRPRTFWPWTFWPRTFWQPGTFKPETFRPPKFLPKTVWPYCESEPNVSQSRNLFYGYLSNRKFSHFVCN